jgi:hypothetical protein
VKRILVSEMVAQHDGESDTGIYSALRRICSEAAMSRGKQRFRQRELTRAIRAADKSGVPVQRVVIDQEGRIIIIPGSPGKPNEQEANEWDNVA